MVGDLTVERLQEIIAQAVNTVVGPLYKQITILTQHNDQLVCNNKIMLDELCEVHTLTDRRQDLSPHTRDQPKLTKPLEFTRAKDSVDIETFLA